MPALSFRTRILLAISLVVAGVTGATLLVTQNRLREGWFRAFDLIGRQQMEYFSSAQKERLVSLRKACLEAARKPALAEAMKSGNAVAAYAEVLPGLGKSLEATMPVPFSLQSILPPGLFRQPDSSGSQPGRSGPPRRETSSGNPPRTGGGGSDPSRGGREPPSGMNEAEERQAIAAKAVWLFNAREELIDQPDENRQTEGSRDRRRYNPMKGFLRRLARDFNLNNFNAQSIGIVPTPVREAGGQMLMETIITPIPDPAGGEPLGAVALGVPLSDLGESAMKEFNRATRGVDFQSGIWMDGRIHTSTIRGDAQKALLLELPKHVDTGTATEKAFEMKIDGRHWRVVCEVLNPLSAFKPATHVTLYSLNPLVEEEASVMRQVLGWGGVALAVGIAAAFFLSHSLTKPLREVTRAANEIRLGNFSAKVPVRSKDEFGQLALSFNEMADGLVEARRYQTLLSQLTDRGVAEDLISGKLTLGGELRDVTVIFCDIRGFTAASEKMPPEEVIAMLNEHMRAMTEVVHAHRGVVDKFVGDLIMALFAAPRAYGGDTEQAARAALGMLEARARLNKDGAWRFDVGIAVTTGMAVAGCMGSEMRLDYTVLGRRVNLASRLCSIAGPGEILIDDETRGRLNGTARTEQMDAVVLKGFETPVSAWRLHSIQQDSPAVHSPV